ncbi:hypothetical protein GC177_07410 [bacterium]|nr:hypothetical protein [bacterium]
MAQLVSVLVYLLIYFGGRLLYLILSHTVEKRLLKHVQDFREESGNIIMMTLLLCWTPFGSLFAVAAGFLRTPILNSFLLILLGQFFFVFYRVWQAGMFN